MQHQSSQRADALSRVEGAPGIYRRGEHGSFVVIVRAGDKQVKRSAKTLAQARKLKAALSTDVARGELQAESAVTLAAYVRELFGTDAEPGTFTGRTSRGVRPETLKDYRRMLERHVLPRFGSKRLRDIRPLHVRRFASELLAAGMAPSMVRLNIAPLRALFATAVEDELIRRNPCSGLRLAQSVETVDDERARALTEAQLAGLIAAVPEQHRLFVEFLAHTGVRISEGIAVQWGDLDLPNLRVHVRRRIYRGTVAPPKTRYGRRRIPLSPGMVERLTERAQRCAPRDTDLVFPSAAGRRCRLTRGISWWCSSGRRGRRVCRGRRFIRCGIRARRCCFTGAGMRCRCSMCSAIIRPRSR
jgi:integrase